MKTRAIIHAGPHKTGTTYLQANLQMAQEELATLGIQYVTAMGLPKGVGRSSRSDMRAWISRSTDAQMRDYFVQAMDSGMRCFIFSDESLASLPPPQVQRLARAMKGIDTEILFYFRRWSDRLPSAWSQALRLGGDQVLPAWIDAALRTQNYVFTRSDGYEWGVWARAFGRDAVTVVSYDHLRAGKMDMYRHFLHNIVEVEDLQTAPAKDVNQSLSPMGAEILRAINHVARQKQLKIPFNARDRWVHKMRRLNYPPFSNYMGEPDIEYVIDDMDYRLSSRREQVLQWRGRFLGGSYINGSDILLPSRRQVNYYDSSWVKSKEARFDLRMALQQMQELAAKLAAKAVQKHQQPAFGTEQEELPT